MSPATTDLLENRLSALRGDLSKTRQEAVELRGDLDDEQRYSEQAAALLTHRRLNGVRIVVVTDAGTARWRDDVVGALRGAGAEVAGTLAFTDAWAASDDVSRALDAVVGPQPSPAADKPLSFAAAAGRDLFDGHPSLRVLLDAKLVAVDGVADLAAWPPPDASVVVLAASHSTGDQPKITAAFVQALARPVLVVGADADQRSALTVLRTSDGLAPTVATFDAGADARIRFASVLALEAAASRRGGHFGTGDGRRLLPEPS